MARIRVTHSIGDLARDAAAVPVKFRRLAPRAVKASLEEGTEDAKRIAREMAGPHGSNYHKRISYDLTGALSGEYGPSAPLRGDYTGVSGADGAMRDLNKSADRLGPRFQRRVGLIADRLFW